MKQVYKSIIAAYEAYCVKQRQGFKIDEFDIFREGWLAAKRAERARRAEIRAKVERAFEAMQKARKKHAARRGK